MKVIPNKGILVTQEDGSPCRSGSHCYWDNHLSGIIQQYLGAFCPTANIVRSPDIADNCFAVEFHKDDQGRELCGKSDSFVSSKAVVPLGDVVAFVDALDAMHKKADDPSISPDNREFIRNFRIPNPLVMDSAWRVLRGEKKLALLWGYANPSRMDSTILPLTETSRKWPDASQRIDIRDMLNSAGRIGQPKSNCGRFILSALAVLCGGALLFALLSNDHGQTRAVEHNGDPTSGYSETVPSDGIAPSPAKPIPSPAVETPPVQQHDDHTSPPENVQDNDNGALEEKPRHQHPRAKDGIKPVWPKGKCCDIHPARLIGGTCPVTCTIHGIHLDKDMRCSKCEKKKANTNDDQSNPSNPSKKKESKNSDLNTNERMLELRCDIHQNQVLIDGECPIKCKTCGSHLEGKDGTECPLTCKIHADTHKVSGVCPKCETPIVIEKAWIEQLEEKSDGTLFYPVFEFKSSESVSSGARVTWLVDEREHANGMRYSPQDGFRANESHQIVAIASFSRSGKIQQLKTTPFTWTKKPIDPKAVERHIGLCGKKTGADGYECFVLKLFSNPDDKKAAVKKWTVESSGKMIPVVDEGQNTMCLYKNQIPKDGKIVVSAETVIDETLKRKFTASFEFKADILSADQSFGSSSVARANAIRELVGPSVVICYWNKSQGTAFAITKRDLITNHHVVNGAPDGNVMLMKQGWKSPIPAKVLEVNPEIDLAWLQVDDDLFNFLPLAKENQLNVGIEVASFGYPYSSELTPEKLPNMTTTLGVIKGEKSGRVWHTAEIYSGNSGGPLIDMRGAVVGVNVAYAGRRIGNEVYDKNDLAIPVGMIKETFPRLAQRLKK